MGTDNHISKAVQWYTQHGPNPLITAILLGLVPYATAKAAWGPTVEVLRSLGRPFGTRLLGGEQNPQSGRLWNEAMDNAKNDSALARWTPRIFGALGTLGSLYAFSNPKQPYKGLLKWNDMTFAKDASFDDAPYINTQVASMDPYVVSLDWNRTIPASAMVGLFKNDPHLENEPYARNMGISIVQNAALTNHTKQPTIGNIFDSAVNKIENKLTVGGLANVALKTAVANGVSRLFAGSLGAMCDLSPQAQQTLVDAGTWAGAITSMLN